MPFCFRVVTSKKLRIRRKGLLIYPFLHQFLNFKRLANITPKHLDLPRVPGKRIAMPCETMNWDCNRHVAVVSDQYSAKSERPTTAPAIPSTPAAAK